MARAPFDSKGKRRTRTSPRLLLAGIFSQQLLFSYLVSSQLIQPTPAASQSARPGQIPVSQQSFNNSKNTVKVFDFGTSGGVVNIPGALKNEGLLYLVSSNPAVRSGILNARSFFNYPGALISSVIPAGGLPGYDFLVPNFSFSLNSKGNFINQGTISSAGSLSINAAQISNLTAPGSAAATISALANLDLNSLGGSIVNSGNLVSVNNNVNFATPPGKDLIIDNGSGVIQALLGAVNVGDTLSTVKQNLAIIGGDIFSETTNLNAGCGIAVISANSLSGVLNVYAGESHVQVESAGLKIGKIEVSGDPTFYSKADLSLDKNLVFSGAPLAIVTSGSILANGIERIETGGGDITLMAGVDFTSSSTSSANPFAPVTLTINGPSSTGGQIELSDVTSINSGGGKILLLAANGFVVDAGSIKVPDAPIVSKGGSVHIIPGTMIKRVSVDTSRVGMPGGAIKVYADTTGCAGCIVKNGIMPADSVLPPEYQPTGKGLPSPNRASLVNGDFVSGGGDILIMGTKLSASSINADSKTGTGGKITVFAGDAANPFKLGSTGDIASVSAHGQTTGGEIVITTFGHLEILADAILDAGATKGNGGSIALHSGFNSEFEMTFDGTRLAVSGTGNNGRGGTVILESSKITLNDHLIIDVSGSGKGDGGTVSLGGSIMTGSAILPSIGKALGELEVFAQGGLSGGNGGNAKFGADEASPFYIDPASLNLNPRGANGNGGSLEARGDLHITSSLDMNGVGTGNGGSIVLFGAFGTDFFIGNGAKPKDSGVKGSLQANSGLSGGSGGRIHIDAFNLTIEEVNSISASTVSGNGGDIYISTPNVLTLGSGSFNVDGSGKSGSGGSISISGDSILLPPGDYFKLSAVGSGTGNGGSISVSAFSQAISTGTGAGQIDAKAHSGLLGGNGGTLKLQGQSVQVNTADYDISPKSKIGNGGSLSLGASNGVVVDGNINLSAVGNGKGGVANFVSDTLFVNGAIEANGAGRGDGGTISAFVNQSLSLDPSATKNGITGPLHAEAGSSGGKGGYITFSQLTNLTIPDPQVVSVATKNGSGGTINFSAHDLNLGGGTYDVSGAGAHGNGGVIFVAGELSSSGHISLKANASGDGNGGNVSVYGDYFFGSKSVVHIGKGSGQVSLEANGGSTNSLKGNAGWITVSSGVFDDLSAIQAIPLGLNGNGARLAFSNFASLNGNLDASGKGTGNGGAIIIQSTTAKSIGPGGDINGTLSVNAKSGKAGTIAVFSFSDISILPGAFSVTSKTGAGGSIDINASNLTFANGASLVANAGQGPGGEIKVYSPIINIMGNNLFAANGSGTGNGGYISVITNSDLQLGSSLISTHANSGTDSGNGGTIEITGNNLTIAPSAVQANPVGKTGNGGTLVFTAYGTLKVLGDISVDGKGNGNGGNVTFDWAHGADTFVVGGASSGSGITGKISANGAGTGKGGTVYFSNTQNFLDSNIVVNSEISALPDSANYGRMLLVSDRFAISKFSLTGSGAVKAAIGTGFSNPISDGTSRVVDISLTQPIDIAHMAADQDINITAPSINLFPGSFIKSSKGTVNLVSASITNDGVIASVTGGVNIQSPSDLSVTGQGTIIAKTMINFSSPGSVFVRQFLPGNNYNSTFPFDIAKNSVLTISELLSLAGQNSSSSGSTTIALDTVRFTVSPVQLPSSSSVVSTDSVPRHVSLETNDEDSSGVVKIGSNKFVVVNNIQSLSAFVVSDNSLEFAEEGTEVTKEEETVYLHKGKMVISTSNKGESIVTPQGKVSVAPNSTTMVKVSSSGTLSAISLNGSSTLQQSQHGDTAVKIEKGQELLSNQDGLEEEELIPVDGIDRGEVITAGLTKAGGRTTVKRSISLKQMVDKDIMINGSLIHVRGATARQHKTYVENLKSGLNGPQDGHRPIAYVQTSSVPVPATVPARAAIPSQKANSNKTQALTMLSSSDAKMQQLQNNYIKLESGTLFVHAKQDTIISTKFCVVQIKAGSCANISTNNSDKTTIRVCTGINSARVFVGAKHDATLSAGEELLISKRNFKNADMYSEEPIGHRNSKTMHCLGLNFAHSEYSIPALLSSSAHLRSMMHAHSGPFKSTREQVLKSAVIVQMVQGRHGRYSVK